MAYPSVRGSAGNLQAATGACTPVIPTHAADDILLLIAETISGEAPGEPGGSWAQVDVSPQDNASENSRLTVWWMRATSASETNPTMSDAGDHIIARVLVIQGCITTGSPFSATAGGTHVGGTGISITGVTTAHAECLCLFIVGSGRDASSALQFTNWANTNLASTGEVFDQIISTGLGGGHGCWRGQKATAGATGATTVDIALGTGGEGGGHITLALRGPSASVSVTPGVGALTLTGFAPTVTASAHKLVTPGVGALVLTAFAPSIRVSVPLTVYVDSVAAAGGYTTHANSSVLADLAAAIGETVRDDATFDKSVENPSNAELVVTLDSIEPALGTVLRYTYGKMGEGQQIDQAVELLPPAGNDVPLASWLHEDVGVFPQLAQQSITGIELLGAHRLRLVSTAV